MSQVVTKIAHLAKGEFTYESVKGAMERVDSLAVWQAENRQGGVSLEGELYNNLYRACREQGENSPVC